MHLKYPCQLQIYNLFYEMLPVALSMVGW